MREIYYKDDIIEVLNTYKVGQRYYVRYYSKQWDIFQAIITCESDNIAMPYHFEVPTIKLFHRPLKNNWKEFKRLTLKRLGR